MTSPTPSTTPTTPATTTTSAVPTTTSVTPTTTNSTTTTTSVSRTPDPARPQAAPDAAMFDAVATEHGVIYGYGLVSAHSTPDVNDLVAAAMRGHRDLREKGIARLAARNVTAPLPAAGYQIPTRVDSPDDAATLAVRMEEDSAVAWRAVLEQATSADDRTLATEGLTLAAVNAAKWRAVRNISPVTVAFPGGSE
jgi:hypothetical protein